MPSSSNVRFLSDHGDASRLKVLATPQLTTLLPAVQQLLKDTVPIPVSINNVVSLMVEPI